MLEKIINEFSLSQLLNVIGAIITIFIAYLKIVPLIPRSANKILSDINVYNKAKESNVNDSERIKESIEREIRRKYKKPTRIYNYGEFIISIMFIIPLTYLIYDRLLENKTDTIFFVCLILDFFAFAVLTTAFEEDETKEETDNSDEEKIIERKAVFKLIIYSWKELMFGLIFIILFGYWTYERLFNTGEFLFDWWSILTILFCLSGFTILTKAFKKTKKQ